MDGNMNVIIDGRTDGREGFGQIDGQMKDRRWTDGFDLISSDFCIYVILNIECSNLFSAHHSQTT